MRLLFFSLILTLVFGASVSVNAQREQAVTLRLNRQAKAGRTNLTIKFVGVEDSRCPQDANCIWAGNAKVTIRVTNRRGESKTFDLNTSLSPKAVNFDGFEIKLGTVTPYPRSNIRINRNGYTATLIVSRAR